MSYVILVVLLSAAVHGSAAALNEELNHKYETLPLEDFIAHFNEQDFSWKMANNGDISIKQGACSITNSTVIDGLEVQNEEMEGLPKSFDSRQNWPQCRTIAQIYNQGVCGSCWAFGTVNAMSDRTCIATGMNIELSPQEMDCQRVEENDSLPVCRGGIAINAYKFWARSGIVTTSCKPYNAYPLNFTNCQRTCVNGANYNNDKHFGYPPYSVQSSEGSIMTDIFKHGPVTAEMRVFKDFDSYKSGVYQHTFGPFVVTHVIRIIGWGEDNGIPYWLIANSWGYGWGISGVAKIKRYDPDLILEYKVIAGHPRNFLSL